MDTIEYYWEDLQPGMSLELGTVTPSAEDIKHFAGYGMFRRRAPATTQEIVEFEVSLKEG